MKQIIILGTASKQRIIRLATPAFILKKSFMIVEFLVSKTSQLYQSNFPLFGRGPIILLLLLCALMPVKAQSLAEMQLAFSNYSGAKLVFHEKLLPKRKYYDRMPVLSSQEKKRAARIALREAQKYPKGYFKKIGLKSFGIFDALVSETGDGFRPYQKKWKGYLYFGLWSKDTIVAAYYTDEQLPLTFHHEVFHHVDSTVQGKNAYSSHFRSDDLRFQAAIRGKKTYSSPKIPKSDLALLRKKSQGFILHEAVSHYATKSPGEDQAETARYFMSYLPDAILQTVDKPKLEGSQRILHILTQYQGSLVDGPGIHWFIDVALGRHLPKAKPKTKSKTNPFIKNVDEEVHHPEVRKKIRQVQPACVRIGSGSGVNIRSDGLIITAAHVADWLGKTRMVTFPNGKKYKSVCTKIDYKLDLAVCQLLVTNNETFPVAKIAVQAPKKNSYVVCIGNPGSKTPNGEATGYTPHWVSVGQIRGFITPILGSQKLGRTMHDAWTYWGHSGGPLFNSNGEIVALHNSWNPKNAMRHAIPQQAILHFLKAKKISLD